MDTTRSRRGCAPPIPAMSPAGHRFQPNSCFVTILLCRDAAASRARTNCCNLPCPQPAKRMWRLTYFRHSERSDRRFRPCGKESHFGVVATAHPALRRQSPLFLLPAPTCKTVPLHTSHSYPSAPRPAFSARPLPQRFLPATPRRAETNSGYDNANVRTRLPRLGKRRSYARFSADMLVSFESGRGREGKLSKLPR